MLQEFTDTALDFTETAVEPAAAQNTEEASDAPVVKLVNLIITEAVQLRASDIHIEPFEDRVRIRYRIDGRLVERDNPPRRLLGAVRELELVECYEAERCCGFGGLFSVKFPMISTAMAEVKGGSLDRTGCDYIVSSDPSCQLQLDGWLSRNGRKGRTIHLAEVLNTLAE